MPIFEVPGDPPPFGFSLKAIVLDDPDYEVGTFDAYVDTNRDYSTWSVESSTGPIIEDVPMNGGRVLRGPVCTQVATGVN